MRATMGEFADGWAWWVVKEGTILASGWHENNKVARQELNAAVEELKSNDSAQQGLN